MSLTLDLSPEVENQVREAALRQQREVSAFIIDAVQEKIELQSLLDSDPEAALDAVLDQLEISSTEISPTALKRASFYGD